MCWMLTVSVQDVLLDNWCWGGQFYVRCRLQVQKGLQIRSRHSLGGGHMNREKSRLDLRKGEGASLAEGKRASGGLGWRATWRAA